MTNGRPLILIGSQCGVELVTSNDNERIDTLPDRYIDRRDVVEAEAIQVPHDAVPGQGASSSCRFQSAEARAGERLPSLPTWGETMEVG